MHRDLKLSNVLISSDWRLKIIDFGLAVQLDSEESERQTQCGTPNYISPEVIHSLPYGLQTDIWSLGCIFYALLMGVPPFDSPTVQQTILKIQSGKYRPAEGSEEAKDLLTQMLVMQPDKRFTIQ